MEIQAELERIKTRRAQLIEEINALADRRQELLAEALRLDGEIRALERLSQSAPEATQEPQAPRS